MRAAKLNLVYKYEYLRVYVLSNCMLYFVSFAIYTQTTEDMATADPPPQLNCAKSSIPGINVREPTPQFRLFCLTFPSFRPFHPNYSSQSFRYTSSIKTSYILGKRI